MQDDMPTKIATETILSTMPVSGLCRPDWSVGLHIAAAAWIAAQMRAGVAGMSMWRMP